MRGELIIYRKGGALRPAIRTRKKGQAVQCFGPDEREDRTAASRIVLETGVEVDTADLDAIWDETERRRAGIALDLLWESCLENPEPATSDAIAALWFGGAPSWEDRVAMLRALDADATFFRQKGEAFGPRDEGSVREGLQREKRREEGEAAKKDLVRLLRERREGRAAPGPLPDTLRPLVARLEEYAIQGDESSRAGWAKDLLREAGLRSDAAEAAASLVALGVLESTADLALRRRGIPRRFPEPLAAAARSLPPFAYEGPPRVDLRSLDAFTVDDARTIDRDDGFAVEPAACGFRLHVIIADVGWFVAPGSALDEEAERRGSSIYLPDGQIPMFPHELGIGRASLDAGTERPVVAISFDVDTGLEIRGSGFAKAACRVARNLTYDEVDRALADGPDPTLSRLAELSRRLREARLRAGAIELPRKEVIFEIDGDGRIQIRKVDPRSPARDLVAELMILANAAGARFCSEAGVPAIYRRMNAPSEPLPDPAAFPHPALHTYEAGHLLPPSEQGPTPGPHAGLGLPAYIQWTSPIRRYQDLVHQRQIAGALAGQPPYGFEDLQRIAGSAQFAQDQAKAVEMERRRYFTLAYLDQTRSEPRDAVCLRPLGPTKHLVELDDCLAREALHTDAPLRPGDVVRVRVTDVDPLRDQLRLALA